VRISRFSVIALGVIGMLISLPFFGFAALGFLGILADWGPKEKRDIGIQAPSLGLLPLICGVVLCVFDLLTFGWKNRRADAEPGAAADRGGM